MNAQVAGMIVNALIIGTTTTVVGYLGIRTFQVFRKDRIHSSTPRMIELTEDIAYIKLKEILDSHNVNIPNKVRFSGEIRISKDCNPIKATIFDRRTTLTKTETSNIIKCLRKITDNDTNYICDYFEVYYLNNGHLNRLNNLEFWEVDQFIKQ